MADEDNAAPHSGMRRFLSSSPVGEGARLSAPAGEGSRSVIPQPAQGGETERVTPAPWRERALAIGEVVVDRDVGTAYRVVRFIGRGGMGEVYEVERADTGERFAIKCMRIGRSDDPKTVERTRQEGIVLQRIRHKNLVPVFAMGVRADGLVWMVMKLLVGWTAGQLLNPLAKVPVPWALEILRDVCLGLEAVHAFAIHRDIKPDNIHVDEAGVTRVLDLGAAKLLQWGLVTTGGFAIGTVAYMSPEQLVTPEAIDLRSDIFSAGVVLYQLLSGQHPFAIGGALVDKQLVGVAILHKPVRPLLEVAPWVPPYVSQVVGRALEKDPEERYPNAGEFARVLTGAMGRLAHDLGPLPALTAMCTALALPEAESPGGANEDGAPVAEGGGETEVLAARSSGGGTERLSLSAVRGADEARAVGVADSRGALAGMALAETEQVASEVFKQAAAQALLAGSTDRTWVAAGRASAPSLPASAPLGEATSRVPVMARAEAPSRPVPEAVASEQVEALAEQSARRAVTERVRRVETAASDISGVSGVSGGPGRSLQHRASAEGDAASTARSPGNPGQADRGHGARPWTKGIGRLMAVLAAQDWRFTQSGIAVVSMILGVVGTMFFMTGSMPARESWRSASSAERAPGPAQLPVHGAPPPASGTAGGRGEVENAAASVVAAAVVEAPLRTAGWADSLLKSSTASSGLKSGYYPKASGSSPGIADS